MKYRETLSEALSPSQKRSILIEALRYIGRFQNKIVVIKYGGAAMLEEHLKESFAMDLVLLHSLGLRPVVVHGGSRTGLSASTWLSGRRSGRRVFGGLCALLPRAPTAQEWLSAGTRTARRSSCEEAAGKAKL